MNPSAMAIATRSRALKTLRNILDDAFYRGSFFLLANTVTTSAIGFVFWTLAAHRYSAPAVGAFSSVISGAGLLAAIAALGLPITMTRHIASAENPRGLVLAAITIIATAGTALCLVTILFLGPHLPRELHIQQHGGMALLVTVLVVFIAMSGTLDAGLVAIRSSRFVLIKNVAGSLAKLAAMLLLTTLGSSGLLISFGLGLVLATGLSGVALGWRTKGKRIAFRSFHVPWHYLSVTSGNYLATVIGMLPLTIVPIEVLAMRGAAETARFSIAFLIAGFLNFIPLTTGQVLFAEISRGEAPLGRQLRKAFRAVYGLLLPSLALLLAAAPFILRLFGRAYAADATGCLRVLALSALPAGGAYLVDSILIARDRTAAYTFMQFANAGLVLGCVGILLPRGLTAAAAGWALAQSLTLILGLVVVATSRTGRHRPRVSNAPAGRKPQHSEDELRKQPTVNAFEPEIRELLAMWPTMPTMLIAERIGWDQSIQMLLERVTELRLAYSHRYQHVNRGGYLPGAAAECSLWFPPTEIPVGLDQTRSARQLPVLTMITGYSRWLSAILIPTRRAEDLFAGWWGLIAELGAVPRKLAASSEGAIGRWMDGQPQITYECSNFCRSLGTAVVVGKAGGSAPTSLIERAQAYLEHSFLRGRSFDSPEDFNRQLRDWLAIDNARHRQPPSYPPAALIAADRNAMLPLPPRAPATGWRLSTRVSDHSFVNFDHNEYLVQPALIGRTVELVADLSQVRILYGGKVVTQYNRAWTRNRTIRDPVRGTMRPRNGMLDARQARIARRIDVRIESEASRSVIAMKIQVSIAVIIPAGPRDDVLDTLASVVHYTGPSRVIILVDDTSGLGKSVGRGGDLWTDTVVIPAPVGAPGGLGGLWVKLAAGYRWALERYEPRMLLRLDTDALLIGHGLESKVERAFASNPAVGLLGSYRIGPDGGPRNSSWAARRLRAETGLRGMLHPRSRSSLRHCLELARNHGYIDGESALGGAYIHRYEAAERMYRHGWFSQPWLASSKLGEDHIMSLLTMAAGYQIEDFGGPVDPMALRWQGLAAHPADLLAARKLVIHSVRSWQDLSERQIREIFAQARTQD